MIVHGGPRMRLCAGEYQLEYTWYGPPPEDAPTLVFLHEGLGCVSLWHDFPERVAAAVGCGALVYSRAGYGKSDAIALPRPVSFMHDEALITLPQVLDAASVREAILVGHSDGGSIALIHAGSGKAEAVCGLILEAPHVFVEETGLKSIARAADRYENGELRRSLQRHHGENVDCAFWGWNKVWLDPMFQSWNIEEYLPNIRVPVLIIQGENDEYGTMRQVEAVRRGCQGVVESVIFSDCGHSPHRDQPMSTLDVITSFIRRELSIAGPPQGYES